MIGIRVGGVHRVVVFIEENEGAGVICADGQMLMGSHREARSQQQEGDAGSNVSFHREEARAQEARTI